MKSDKGHNRIARWSVAMSEFDYEVIHRKGHLNDNSDAPSRQYAETTKSDIPIIPLESNEIPPQDSTPLQNLTALNELLLIDCSPAASGSEIENNLDEHEYYIPSDGSNSKLQEAANEDVNLMIDTSNDTMVNNFVLAIRSHDLESQPSIAEWAEAQAKDEKLKVLINFLKGRGAPADATREAKQQLATTAKYYALRGGILDHKSYSNRLRTDTYQHVVPSHLRETILRSHHSGPMGGHLHFQKMWSRISSKWYWIGMRKDIKTTVRNCLDCEKDGNVRMRHGQLKPSESNAPNELVFMDYCTILVDEYGYKGLLLLVDHFTSWVEAIPVKSESAPELAQAIYNWWITRYGCPNTIHSDGGRTFLGALVVETHKLMGIKMQTGAPYHSESQGKVERIVQTFKRMLKRSMTTNQLKQNWSQCVQGIAFAYRTAFLYDMQDSPSFLWLGRDVRHPLSLQTEPSREETDDSIRLYKVNQFEILQQAYKDMKAQQAQRRAKYKLYFDRTHSQCNLKPGDLVFRYRPTRGYLSNSVIRKWTGPGRIHRAIPDRPNTFEVHDWETKTTTIEHSFNLKRVLAPVKQICTVKRSANARSRRLEVLIPEVVIPVRGQHQVHFADSVSDTTKGDTPILTMNSNSPSKTTLGIVDTI